MRYLVSIDSFKKLKYEQRTLTTELRPIKEQFENDITWGGSLIGRLINSTVRVLGIRYRATKISGLVKELEKMLYVLLAEETSFSEKNKLRELRANALLAEIYKIVMDKNHTVEEKIQILLSVSDYKARQNRQSSAGTPQNASFEFNKNLDKIFEYAEQDKEEDKKDERDTTEDGLIDTTIRDIKSCDIDKKELLIEKLEKFKKLLMEIEFKKEEEKEEEKDKKEISEETKKKYKLYSETRKFLEGYLDIIRQIESNSVKQQSPFKKGEIVMWKLQSGATKGTLSFGEVLKDVQDNDEVVQVKRLEGKNKGGSFGLPLKHALALTYFDENYYRRMRESTPKEIQLKLIKAKIGYYTFLNKKDRAKWTFYEEEMDRLEKKLPKDRESEMSDLETEDKPASKKPQVGTTNTSGQQGALQKKQGTGEVGIVKASFEYFLEDESLILEEATVRIKTKEQIGAWGYIVDVYSNLKKKEDMKEHVQEISDLLEGKPSGKEARKKITSIGSLIHKLLTSKYKPVPINDLKGFTKETPTTLVKTESYSGINEAQGLPANDTSLETAEVICKLARVILSLEQDMLLAKSFVDSSGEGVSKSILKMISSFDGIKDAVNEQKKNESTKFLKKYSDFRLILEADDDDDGPDEGEFGDVGDTEDDDEDEDKPGDEEQPVEGESTEEGESESGELDAVQIAWFDPQAGGKGPFSKGEEKEWVVNIEEIKKPIGPEKGKISIDVKPGDLKDPKLDPIIRIMNIFGKAYSLYATDYIPSGRPEGRVSQRTLREYEYIGKGGEGEARGERGKDYFTPGYGPWAARRTFEKWEDGVNSLLEDKWLRKVLANINYVSQAERETGMEQIEQTPEKSSGITLLRFITEMLTLKGTFKENKRTLMLKYFNADLKDTKDDISSSGRRKVNPREIEKENEPVFIRIADYNSSRGTNPVVTGSGVRVGYFYKVKIKMNNVEKIWILWACLKTRVYTIFRAQQTDATSPTEESMITARFAERNFMYKKTKLVPPLRNRAEKEVFLVGVKTSDLTRKFKPGESIDLHIWKNLADIRTIEANYELKTGAEIRADFQIMVVSSVTTNGDVQFKPVEITWLRQYKAQADNQITEDEKTHIQTKITT